MRTARELLEWAGRLSAMALSALLSAAPLAAGGQPPIPPEAAGAGGLQLRSALSAAPLPEIETFMQIGAAGGPVLSSDGESLFFVSSQSGTSQIYRLLPGGWPYQLTFSPDGADFSSFNRDCSFAVIGTDSGGNEQYQLSLLDARTGAIRPLTSDPKVRHGGPVWAPDGLHVYYTANAGDPSSFYVYEMDMRSGRSRLVSDMKGSNGVVDVSADGSRLILYHATTSQDNSLYLVDVRTGKSDLITPHTGEHSFSGGVFTADGRYALLTSDDNPDGLNRLARIDLATRRLEFILNDDPRWEVETFNISDNRRFLAWVMNEDGYGRLHLYDLEAGRPLPVPVLDGIVSSPVPVDAGFLTYSFNSPTRTADVWVWDFREAAGLRGSAGRGWSWGRTAAGGIGRPGDSGGFWRGAAINPVQATFSSYAGVDPEIFHEPTLIRYRSFDGMEIPAFLYLPPDYNGRPIPFIVEAHGGPAQEFRPYFNRHFQYLLQHGFGILAPNFRGSSGYGRAFKDADNYRKRLDSVKDVAAGAQWLIAQGYARQGQIGIKGASYGGYMTLAAMTEYPDIFAAGIDQVGVANFETFLEKTADYRRSLRESEYGPLTDREFLRSISPLYKADRIRGALMVVHGANDPRVPVGEARQILRAVQANGTPVDSLIYPDEGHGISKRPNQLLYYKRMVAFFEKHLPK